MLYSGSSQELMHSQDLRSVMILSRIRVRHIDGSMDVQLYVGGGMKIEVSRSRHPVVSELDMGHLAGLMWVEGETQSVFRGKG